ncbi:MAG TPA: pilus assembly protein PilN, partial [Xanthobacteraceae bacterium]|nr:pilus assembly protein PilN [Xanthobacteraceae bacterium]
MTLWRTIGEILAHWTDTVATGVIAVISRFVSPRLVRLIEDDKPDTFALEGAGKVGNTQQVTFANGRFSSGELAELVKGSRLELVLRPSRFLVRPLELPARATEFIEGIVRVQI